MQLLKYIETSFEKQPLRVKIELIILPFLILFSYFYFFKVDNSLQSNQDMIVRENIIPKKMSVKLIEIIKGIEKFCKEKNINLSFISDNNEQIRLQVDANEENLAELFTFIENYNPFTRIKEFNFEKNTLSMTIDFKKFYVKNKPTSKHKNISLTLNAIIEEKVCINGKWLGIGDEIEGFKIAKIQKEIVVIKNKKGFMNLRLFENEYL